MTAQEYANGLRAIATWYENHPEIPVPVPEIQVLHMGEETKDMAVGIARALGHCDKDYGASIFYLIREFGGIKLKFAFWRSTICTRRVVGTRIEPARPATPEREVEIIEWDCPESLLDSK